MELKELKILPFECNRGKVAGHALRVAITNGSHVSHVVVWTFDDAASCGVEVIIPIHDWTKYQYRKWPNCGEVRAVMLANGQRMHAKGIYAGIHGETAWKAAPILCAGVIEIRGLCSEQTLVEVSGAMAWCYSQRQPEDAGLLIDPWARDNAAFKKRTEEVAA